MALTGTSLTGQRKRTKKYWDWKRLNFKSICWIALSAKTQEESLLQTLKELDQFETEFEQLCVPGHLVRRNN